MTDDPGPLLDPTGQYVLRSPRTAAEMRQAQEATDRAEQLRAERRRTAEQAVERLTQILALHATRSVSDQSCRECGDEWPCPTALLAGAPDPDDEP